MWLTLPNGMGRREGSHTSREKSLTLGRRCIFSESLESGMELIPTISLPSNQSSSFLTIYICKYQEGFLGEGLGLG
ncbi:hypothetical protein HanIR_Chr11g0560501 [Helianthus annuus]|nr:hypothetical protein HanIR_Chr11g0560501 [Helianthus annuus]